METNYQINHVLEIDPTITWEDFLLSTGDDKGWGDHADYISGWQQETVNAALNTWNEAVPGECAFNQFAGDIPLGGNGDMTYYKPTPVEDTELKSGVDQLLVDQLLDMSVFPAADSIWSQGTDAPDPVLDEYFTPHDVINCAF